MQSGCTRPEYTICTWDDGVEYSRTNPQVLRTTSVCMYAQTPFAYVSIWLGGKVSESLASAGMRQISSERAVRGIARLTRSFLSTEDEYSQPYYKMHLGSKVHDKIHVLSPSVFSSPS